MPELDFWRRVEGRSRLERITSDQNRATVGMSHTWSTKSIQNNSDDVVTCIDWQLPRTNTARRR